MSESLSDVLERERLALALYVAYEKASTTDASELLVELADRCKTTGELATVLLSVPSMILRVHDAVDDGVETAKVLISAMAVAEGNNRDKVWNSEKQSYEPKES